MDAKCHGMETIGHSLKAEIAATAARVVVEEGLEFGPAKRRAIRHLGLSARSPLPGNDEVEDAVLDYIAVFCSDTQPGELAALRRLALHWMERMPHFAPIWVRRSGMAPRPGIPISRLACSVTTRSRPKSH